MSNTFKIYNGDVVHSAINGRPTLITEGKKIRQDLTEFFTIYVQPNGFGAGIEELVGIVESSQEAFQGLVYKQISDGLVVFLELQAAENKIFRNPNERIISFSNIRVERDHTDYTKFMFKVNAITASGEQIPLTNLLASITCAKLSRTIFCIPLTTVGEDPINDK